MVGFEHSSHTVISSVTLTVTGSPQLSKVGNYTRTHCLTEPPVTQLLAVHALNVL
jgi:hypothetical protein